MYLYIMYIYTYMYVYICIYIYICVYTYIYIRVYIYAYIYMNVYTYICIYIYIYTSPQLRGYKFYCVSQLIGAISHIYIYIWRLIYINSFMRTRPFFAKKFFSWNFRELHVYLSQDPCVNNASYENIWKLSNYLPNDHRLLHDSLYI